MKDMSGYCALWRNILGNRRPGDLSSQEHKAFSEHLELCPACMAMLAQEIDPSVNGALLPRRPLLEWDEIVIKHAKEQALSSAAPIDPQEVSAAVARTVAPSAILEKIFDIQEVKTTRILKEKAEQFIGAWPLLSEAVGGRSLRVGKGG